MSSRPFPPPSQASDPGFLQALRHDEMRDLVQQHLAVEATVLELQPDYVRWKDADGSLVGYHVTLQTKDAVVHSYVVARAAAPARLADEAERLHHRAEETHAGLAAFAFLQARSLLLLGFPIDRQMHDLRRLVRASKLRTFVETSCPSLIPPGHRFSKSRSAWQLVSYRPERRAVMRWQIGLVGEGAAAAPSPILWIRCHAEEQAARTTAATTAAAAGGLRCPRTLGVAHERLMFESHVAGRPWSPFLRAEARDTDLAARALATLHATKAPSGLPVHHTPAELDLVLLAAEDLGRLDPRLGELGRGLADRLAHAVPPAAEPVFAHGDLHCGQFLIGAADAGLVDFDRACTASAAHDLATFTAQSLERDARRGAEVGREFTAAYARHRALPAAAELGWWTACALVRNATRPFRRLAPDWRVEAAALLARADEVLRGGIAKEASS